MLLQLASDIHTEFWPRDQGRKVLQRICKNTSKEVDAILIPGDLCTAQYIKYAFSILCKEYKNVIYTLGNHEFYGYSKREVHNILDALQSKHSNLHVLNNSTTEIDGQRFIGTSLWYPATELAIKHRFEWSDFKHIKDGYEWIFKQHTIDRAFLEREMTADDIVLTHFLPCPEAIHPKWAGHLSNCYFLSDISDLIKERQPKLMVAGHTHNVMRFDIGKTKFYINPLGYPNYGDEGKNFDDSLIIEV